MRVPHADFSARTVRLTALVAVTGAAFFLAQYLIADRRSVPEGRLAAMVGSSSAVLVWSFALAWFALHAWPRRGPVETVLTAFIAVLPHVAFGWMVFDLLLDRQPFGPWVSIAPVALLPGIILLAAGAGDRHHSEEPVGQPTSPARRSPHLGVGVDSAFWSGVIATVSPRDEEQGGVALTTTVDGLLVVVGVVLPVQVTASAVWCEFEVADVERVREALDTLEPEAQERIGLSWLHTHPRLGVFLSGTDRATSARWRILDPRFRPVVVDVSKSSLTDQIGVFDADDRPIEPIGLVDDAIDAKTAELVLRAVLDRYEREGLPRPTILIGPVRSADRDHHAVDA